jgi:hypothetical protein
MEADQYLSKCLCRYQGEQLIEGNESMNNSEQEYPLHQPSTQLPQASQQNAPTIPVMPDNADNEPTSKTKRRVPSSLRGTASTSQLPRGRLKNAVITGVIAGFLCIAQSIIITFVNASTYKAYDTAYTAARHATGANLTQLQATENALAFTIFGYAVLTFIISLIILLVAGYIAGKIVVERRLAFLAGFIAGILDYGISFITRYIPSYPGNQTVATSSSSTVVVNSIFIVIILFLVWGVIGGLVTLLGAWIASRKHPYYTS